MTVEQNSTLAQEREGLSHVIKIDQTKVSNHLNGLVRQTVQETLNQRLDAEAQEMCNAPGTNARRPTRTAGGLLPAKTPDASQRGGVERAEASMRHVRDGDH